MKRVWLGMLLSIILTCFVSLAVPFGSVEARTIVVPDDYSTIQEAIHNADDGDTIFVRNGVYYENVIVYKSVSLIGEDRYNTVLNLTYPMDYFSLRILADNVVVSGFSLVGYARAHVLVDSASNVTIKENIFEFCCISINCTNSENSSILNNMIKSSSGESADIFLDNCTGYLVINNTVTVAPEAGPVYYGMYLRNSSNNLISGNLIDGYHQYGIVLSGGNGNDGNIIFRNTIMDCYFAAIWIEDDAGGNQISASLISNNYLGILFAMDAKGNNTLFHNTFVENLGAVVFTPPAANNDWSVNDEGNYWDDYNGTDSDGDGIGDVPYIINSNNIDNYPLMNVYWNPCDINHDLTIDMKDIGISARAFATIPGDTDWNPHADITGPEHLVPDSKVDMRDIGLIARYFGETYSSSENV